MTIQQLIDEQMKEFDKKFSKYIKTVSIGQYDNSGVNVGFLAAKDVILKWHTDVTRKLIEAVGEELIGEDEKPLFSERYETAGHQDKSLRKRGRNELRSIQRLKMKEIINSLK